MLLAGVTIKQGKLCVPWEVVLQKLTFLLEIPFLLLTALTATSLQVENIQMKSFNITLLLNFRLFIVCYHVTTLNV